MAHDIEARAGDGGVVAEAECGGHRNRRRPERADERPFAPAARVSEVNLTLYRALALRPDRSE